MLMLLFPNAKCGYGVPKFPALGLAYLAGSLKKDVICLDLRIKNYGWKDVESIILLEGVTHVGFHCTVLNFKEVVELNKKIKETHPRIKTIVGGPHASMCPEEFKGFDSVVAGEAEQVIKDYKNLGKLTVVEPIKDLDSLDFPDWSVFGQKQYFDLPIMTTRGCPYNCIFCNVRKVFGQLHRKRSVANIIAEIERNVKEYGMTKFEIIDDNFSMDPDFVKQFCNVLIDKKLNLKWDCPQGVRIDRLDEEAFRLMKASGCKMIGVGVESGNQAIVNNINKALDLEVAKEKIKLAKKAGLIVKAFFVIGSPGEKYENVLESIQFFKDNKIDIPRFGMLAPYPGTPIHEWAKKNARILIDDVAEFTHGLEYDDVKVAFDTPDFPAEERLKAYNLANREAEIWLIRMNAGFLLGWLARSDSLRKFMKNVYTHSSFLKKHAW